MTVRNCKYCGSKLILMISDVSNYIWRCDKFPNCNNIENTILRIQINSKWKPEEQFNSMKFLKPSDIVTDADRHYAINKRFKYDHKFNLSDIENLDFFLGFESKPDFFFWIATQKHIVKSGVHHYLPVGSPYFRTFRNLVKSVNNCYQNIIKIISANQSQDIESSIKKWSEYFKILDDRDAARLKESKDNEEKEHNLALQRKSDKASINIFNAIRRKDVKAIIELRKKGADLNYKNENGINFIEYAKEIGDERVIESLTKKINQDLK